MGKKVVTLGEIMLRLSTPGNTRFVQSDSFDVVYGGGEANVAVSCANYGHDAYFVTKLPKHEIGQSAVNALRKYGVKTDFIARGGDRVGIYYLETGASMRPSKVIYDRAHSAIAEADAADADPYSAVYGAAGWLRGTDKTEKRTGSEAWHHGAQHSGNYRRGLPRRTEGAARELLRHRLHRERWRENRTDDYRKARKR